MKALLLRELRRLAPYGLGAALLALALPPTDDAGLVLHAALAAVLGVAAVAPDTAAGGTAFLLRLPARPVQVAAVKLLVAALWVLPALVAALARDPRGVGVGIPCLFAAGLGAGALASVVAHRVMPAVLLAPMLLAAFGLMGVVPLAALRTEPRGVLAFLAAPAAIGLASVGLAALAFAHGERHRPTPRPALLAGAGLAALAVLSFGSTAAAHAWTLEHVAPGALRAVAATPIPGGGLVVELDAALWCGHERRIVVLGPGDAWQVPLRGVAGPEVSPDGRLVLLAGFPAGGWLLDLDARTTTPLPGFEPHRDVAWGPEGAVTLTRSHQGLEPVDVLRLAPAGHEDARVVLHVPGAHYVGLAEDGRALLVDDAGVLASALPAPGAPASTPPAERLVRWPAGLSCQQALPVAGGRLLVLDPEGTVHALDLRTGDGVALTGWDEPVYLHRSTVQVSPCRRRAAARITGGRIVVVDLATGARVLDARPPADAGPTTRLEPAWTPDGEALALPWGPVASIEGGQRAAVPGGALGFVAGRAVARGAALADVLGGAR
ncbi:MAG: PQQ-like beta-propeller repeat protein [Planctomycetes bacterium]|nr:PQQ-like beta-propeller repeat protein [Planctomycetota bacterium]